MGNSPAPLTVLMVTEDYPTASETFIQREIVGLEQRGISCPVCSYATRPAIQFRPQLRAWVTLMPLLARYGLLHALRHGWRAAALFATQPRPHHVHGHFAGLPAYIGRALAQAWHVPFTISVHARDVFVPWAPGIRAAGSSQGIAACSQAAAEACRSLLPTPPPIRVIHHAVPLEGLPAHHPPKTPTILSAGRLVPKKGMDTLLQAVALLEPDVPGLQLRIAGDGPQRGRIEELIRQLRLTNQVRLLGQIGQEALQREMSHASLFCLACRKDGEGDRDGIPNVLLEAMAIGLPVTACNAGGIAEVVLDGVTGHLVDSDSPEALAHVLREQLEHPDPHAGMTERARDFVREQHSPIRNAERFTRFFLEIGSHELH
ncbi:MAG: glycosyltransferase [Planctomycetota bacterium]